MAETTTTTDSTAASQNPGRNTTDAQANATQAVAQAGAVTDTAATQSQAQESNAATVDPKVAAALKALEDAGVQVYTERQVNGREAALRRKMEADAVSAAQKAQQEAEAKALAEQGQFKPLYEQAQAALKAAETRMAEVEPTLVGFVDAAIKEWPKVLLDKRPTTGGYTALQAWYEAYKDIATEMLKTTTQGKAQQYSQQAQKTTVAAGAGSTGGGQTSRFSDTGTATIEPYVSRRQA